METAPELLGIPLSTWGPGTILTFVAVLFFTGKIIPAKRAYEEVEYWRKAFFQVSDQMTKLTHDRSLGTQAIQKIAEQVDQDA